VKDLHYKAKFNAENILFTLVFFQVMDQNIFEMTEKN